MLDIARDPRWGRTEETYGEDPYLAARMGDAAVRGFQGTGPAIDKSHVIATAKHFAVHGQPEGGSNVGPGNYSERVIREYFLKPFEAAGEGAGIRASWPPQTKSTGSSQEQLLLETFAPGMGIYRHGSSLILLAFRQLRSKHHVVPQMQKRLNGAGIRRGYRAFRTLKQIASSGPLKQGK